MADYTLDVAVRGDLSGLNSTFRQAQTQIRGFGDQVAGGAKRWGASFTAAAAAVRKGAGDAAKWARTNEQEVRTLGTAYTAFGAAVVAGLGFAAKAAIDWETAWAGVVKTTDATASQLPALEKGLRGLANEIPATHEEIAAVAEAAGQLGIKSENVLDFTKVMLAMGEATNLSSDQAATSLAQMMNIMQTAPGDVERLASTIVDLGNNGASTEAEITEMSLRIAGAGHQIGLTEANVVSFANAMASVGIRAEAGGSSISRVFTMISTAVNDGGEQLQKFADVAGMSAQDFATSFKNTPAQAIDAFIVGLGEISEAGGDVFGTLADLKINSVEMRDVVLRLAGAGSLLTESLEMGDEAWRANTALMAEASKRYETTASRIQIAKNQLSEVGIEIGETLLPSIAGLADGAADLMHWFAELPEPIKNAVSILGTLAGGLSLAGGGFLLLLPKILDFRDAWKSMPASISGATGRMGRFLKVAGGITAIVTALETLNALTNETAKGTEEVDASVKGLASSKDVVKDMFGDLVPKDSDLARGKEFAQFLHDMAEPGTLKTIGAHLSDLGVAVTSLFGDDTAKWGELKDRLAQYGDSIGTLATTDMPAAAEAFNAINDAAGGTDQTAQDLLKTMPAYRDALYGLANAQGMTLDETSLLKLATGEMQIAQQSATESAEQQAAATEEAAAAVGMSKEQYEEATKAVQDYRDSLDEASRSFIDIGGTYTQMYDEQKAAAEEAAKKTAESKGLEGDAWKQMVGDVRVSLDEYIAELERQAEAQKNWQSNLMSLTDDLSAGTISYLQSLGPEGANLVQQLTEGSKSELEKFDALTQQTLQGASADWVVSMEQGMALVQAVASEKGSDAAAALADSLASGKTTVQEAANDLGATIEETVPGQWTVNFDAKTDDAYWALNAFAADADHIREGLGPWPLTVDGGPARREAAGTGAAIENASPAPWALQANGSPAKAEGSDTASKITGMEPFWKIDADGKPAIQEGQRADRDISKMTPEMDVEANTKPAKETVDDFISKARKVVIDIGSKFLGGWGDGEGAGWPGSAGGPTPHGVSAMSQAVKAIDPGARITSGYRPGAVTATGYPSYHGMGRAIDIVSPNMGRTWDMLARAYGSRAKELYYSPRGFIRNGRMTNDVAAVTRRMHYSHVHLALRGGGSVFGPGTGTSDDIPAWLSNGEHVWTAKEVRAAGGHSAVEALRAAVLDGEDLALRFASGGAVRSAENGVRSAVRDRERAAKRLRDARAAEKRAEKAAKKKDSAANRRRVSEAEKRTEKREKAYEDAKERVENQRSRLSRLREENRDTRLDLRRGDIRDQATSSVSGAYSVVDRMFDLARSGDLTKRQSTTLSKKAYAAEISMRRLYKQADKVAASLEKARDRAEELRSIADKVSNALQGEQSLSDAFTTNPWSGKKQVTAESLVAGAQAKAAQINAFAGKIKRLVSMGYSPAIVEEVAGLGSEEGSLVADALIRGGASTRYQMNAAYKRIQTGADKAGQYTSEAGYKGGAAYAEGVVKGLESQQKQIENQILKIAKGMETALKRALGIKSPSRVGRDIGANYGGSVALGVDSQADAVAASSAALASAMEQPVLSAATNYTPSSAYGKTNVTAVVDQGAMAQAMNGVSMTLLVDGKPVRAIVQTEVGAMASAASTTMRGGRR